MQARKPIIVGIDPGTTTAYAVLDTGGNLIEADSSRNMGLAELISRTARLGKVIIAGTDKRKVPELVYKYAARMGAKIMSPDEDIPVAEKKSMAKEFHMRNEHENDALASALEAFKGVRHIVEKINRTEYEDKELLKEMVIKNGMSIKGAMEHLNPKTDEEDTEMRESSPVNTDKLMSRLRAYEREIYFLRKYISKLKNEKFPKQRQIMKPMSNERVSSLFRFKEERIRSYSNMLKEKDSQISALKQEIMEIGNIVTDSKNHYILKKLRNLGYLEYEHKKITLKIEDGDILLVDDPNIISRRTLEEIKDKISKIVCEKPMSRKTEDILSAAVISADRLQIHDFGQFAAVRKEALDREIDKKSVFRKIIIEYKKEKEATLMSHS